MSTPPSRLAEQVGRRAMAQLLPPPTLTVSQWADAERRLPRESSAEPGRWRTDRAPYQRGIMDAVQDPSIETIVVKSSSQIGKTECLLNVLGYHVDLDPCPILVIEPTLELAGAISKDRLTPMLRDTPSLRGKVREARAKDTTNTTLHKTFPGGHLTLAGANSPASLASRPIRLLLADEVDRYPAHLGEEGDPLALGIKRTATFWNRTIVIASSPTIKGASRIDRWFEQSDQRLYHVPCPRCGVFFVLAWRLVRWEHEDPATAHLVCPSCDGRIDDRERPALVKAGEWRATAPFHGTAGFHVWEAYSPWRRLSQIVADFLKANAQGPEALRVWVNTALGESWEEQAEHTPPHVLLARCEAYAAPAPVGVCCVTCGVDTQDDRLEVLVVGWGPGEEAWILDVETIPGDPQRPEPWAALDRVLALPYAHASGAQLPILATCVDSAGHRTDYVYEFVRRRQHLRVYATIGRDGERSIVSAPQRRRTGRNPRVVDLYTIGVDPCKALVASRLQRTAPGPGYLHFPAGHPRVTEEFFAQLTAERLVTRYRHGIPMRQWVQTRPRNEALDCAVLATAALRLLNPRLDTMAQRLRAAAAAPLASGPAGAAAPPAGSFDVSPPASAPATGRLAGRRFARSRYLSS